MSRNALIVCAKAKAVSGESKWGTSAEGVGCRGPQFWLGAVIGGAKNLNLALRPQGVFGERGFNTTSKSFMLSGSRRIEFAKTSGRKLDVRPSVSALSLCSFARGFV
jgi:hypothetical protein